MTLRHNHQKLPSTMILLDIFPGGEPIKRKTHYHLLTQYGEPGPVLGSIYTRSHSVVIIIFAVLELAKHFLVSSSLHPSVMVEKVPFPFWGWASDLSDVGRTQT